MRPCDNCGESVDARWKFCLHCGAKMLPMAQVALAIPGAIRPGTDAAAADDGARAVHVGKRRLRFDWQLTLGIVLAAAGVVMIGFLVVVLVLPHG